MTNKCWDQTASPISANLLYLEVELIICSEKSALQENGAQEPCVKILIITCPPSVFHCLLVCCQCVTDNHLHVFRDSPQEKSALGLLKRIIQFSRINQWKCIAVCRE